MKVLTKDDLIEFEGEFSGEVGCFGTGALVVVSDGTVLEIKYGKNDAAIWGINVLQKGSLFMRLDLCTDENADPYSDVAHFKKGVKWAYAATGDWEKVS